MSVVPDTAMAAAFAAAKMKSPAGRLRDMAGKAIERAQAGAEAPTPTVDHEAGDRLQRYARNAMKQSLNIFVARGIFLEALMNDAAALNELMGDKVPARASEYLNQLYNEDRASSGGHGAGGNHVELAARRNGGGQGPIDAQPARAPAALPDRRSAAASTMRIVANSILSTMLVDGVPIRQCTAAKVLESAAKDARTARFKERLCGGLQPEMVVGEYVDDERANQLWSDAE